MFGTKGLNTSTKLKETKLFKLTETKGELHHCSRISFSCQMEDSDKRWKHKEEAQAEWKDPSIYVTQIQIKKQVTAQAFRTPAFSETSSPITRLSYQNTHSEHVLSLCFLHYVNSKGRSILHAGILYINIFLFVIKPFSIKV